jgi:serine/threonine protein kinase
MESSDTIQLKTSNPSRGRPGLVYHCVCGFEFQVDPKVGGACGQCKRVVQPEAIQNAMSATVSIANFQDSDDVHHFELESDEPLPNRLYGHFRIDRKLGSGGMGAVYRAMDTSLQRYVAVKVMRNANHCIDSRIAMLLREAVAQARLNHPNVVTIYYVGRQDEEPFLAMELLPGPTLAEKMKSDGSIPYADAIQYAIQVASALRHASQFGIVHADIKPANLLIAGEGRIKLSDFGLSRIQSDPEQNTSVSGTPAYVAPELIRGNPISVQSDMYALGVTLFELVFGKLPFALQGVTLRERLETHLTADIEFPAVWPNSIPREFADVIRKLLAKAPDARYATYDDLIDALKLIEPVKTTTAGVALRTMAYAIDQFALLLFFVPFAFAILLFNTNAYRDYQWLSPIVAFMSLIVPATYLLLIYRGWRTIGRYLFQLRIVEENGLRPRREQLVTREVLRNSFAWFVPLVIYVDPSFSPDHLLSRILQVAFALFLAIDWATTLLLKGRKTLHDYLCHSRVVLAVDRAK